MHTHSAKKAVKSTAKVLGLVVLVVGAAGLAGHLLHSHPPFGVAFSVFVLLALAFSHFYDKHERARKKDEEQNKKSNPMGFVQTENFAAGTNNKGVTGKKKDP